MKEYNVALNKDVDYDKFWDEMENVLPGHPYIPERAVEFTNERPGSLRQCWYLLTDEEAEILKGDGRIYCVEIPPEHRTDIQIGRLVTETFDFTKNTSSTGTYANWGLIRSNSLLNVYGVGTTTSLNYTYNLAGKGVDVVIQDSGLQVDHPEFQDEFGNSRVQQINWATASGLSFTQSPNHYRDYNGHGTHCAGISCGKTYGWAKKANVYSLKVSGLEGTGDSGTGISITYCFDAIRLWHISKNGSRPTVVNMSWGYSTGYNSVTSLNYRGTSHNDSSTTGNSTYRATNYGLLANSGASLGTTYSCPVRVDSVDVSVQELVDAGVIVCIAAGNNSFKIDTVSGPDYNNYVVTDQGTIYYHRGSSPYYSNAIMVGALDRLGYDANNDKKASYSCAGPGVDIFAPGTNIQSCTSNTNGFSGVSYYANSAYKQLNISGTSMATPQVTGVAALLCEANPKTPSINIKKSLVGTAGTAIYTTGLSTDYTTNTSLLGGTQKVLYNKFNNSQTFSITGGITLNTNFNI